MDGMLFLKRILFPEGDALQIKVSRMLHSSVQELNLHYPSTSHLVEYRRPPWSLYAD
jgi:hypothetical protein